MFIILFISHHFDRNPKDAVEKSDDIVLKGQNTIA